MIFFITCVQGFSEDQTLDLEEYRKLKKPQLGVNPDDYQEIRKPSNEPPEYITTSPESRNIFPESSVNLPEPSFEASEPDSTSSVSGESLSDYVVA